MTQRGMPPEPPHARDLLTRATWADLDRIASRYGVPLPGRRRELAVERLGAIFDHPERLRAAAGILTDGGRCVLRLLLLLGAADDERDVAAARDRLLEVQPDAVLQRLHLPSELQTLMSLGLVFADKRRLVVPAEVLGALPLDLVAADAPPADSPRSFADVRATVDRLVHAITDSSPAATTPQPIAARLMRYRPRPMPPDAADDLARRTGVDQHEVLLWVSLLETSDVLSVTRGRWQAGSGWETLHAQPPPAFARSLLGAWLQPRRWSDLAASKSLGWICAPDVECASLIALHEAQARRMIWRWLRSAAVDSVDINAFTSTLAAIHPSLFAPLGNDVWIAPEDRSRGEAAPVGLVAPELVRTALSHLRRLGLITADESRVALTPLARWLDGMPLPTTRTPSIRSHGMDELLVDPLRADSRSLDLIHSAGRIIESSGEQLRYRLTASGMARLLEQGIASEDLQRHLHASGAVLEQAFEQQLDEWAHRTGRLRLHHPLAVLLTPEDAPLSQILVAAGVANAADIIGPGCALIERQRIDAAIEQLRARGFWPVVEG